MGPFGYGYFIRRFITTLGLILVTTCGKYLDFRLFHFSFLLEMGGKKLPFIHYFFLKNSFRFSLCLDLFIHFHNFY